MHTKALSEIFTSSSDVRTLHVLRGGGGGGSKKNLDHALMSRSRNFWWGDEILN